MRQLVALMLLMALSSLSGSVNAARLQRHPQESGSYATAGSEDIYFQPYHIHELSEELVIEDMDNGSSDPMDDELDEEKESESDEERTIGENLNAIDEDEFSCEYSCPRYYRPVCVRRDGELITFATPCEYHNQLRCANVAKRQHGIDTPTFQLMYNNACRT